jgi:hypothetical protein
MCRRVDMANKPKFKVAITRLTENGAYIYGGCEELRGEATFTSTYEHCYFGELILKKVKGGKSGGNYSGIENNEIYRVMKFEKL